MRKRKHLFIVLTTILLVITIAVVYIYNRSAQLWDYGFDRPVSQAQQQKRLDYIAAAEKWLGAQEGSPEHRQILEIYNTYEPLAQGYLIQESDNWCAAFISTVAIQCDLTQIIPTECGCQRQIGLFKEMGRWEEADDYIPLPGDIIYYCSKDINPFSDCTGWSDHVGIVVGTCRGYIKVIEGNYNNTVQYRYVPINDTGIRGFALPEYE